MAGAKHPLWGQNPLTPRPQTGGPLSPRRAAGDPAPPGRGSGATPGPLGRQVHAAPHASPVSWLHEGLRELPDPMTALWLLRAAVPPAGASAPARDLTQAEARDLVVYYALHRQLTLEKPIAFGMDGQPTFPRVGEKVKLGLAIGGVYFTPASAAAASWTHTGPLDLRMATLAVRLAQYLHASRWGVTMIFGGAGRRARHAGSAREGVRTGLPWRADARGQVRRRAGLGKTADPAAQREDRAPGPWARRPISGWMWTPLLAGFSTTSTTS